jgi:ADP-heptose:LPS heptosyltransferase
MTKNTPLEDYKSILVIKLGALGDIIQAMGAFKRVRDVHPNAHITLMTTKGFKTLAEDCGYFDDIYVDHRPKWYDIGGLIAVSRFIKCGLDGQGFERVYDMQNNDRSKLYFRFFPKDREWVGTAKGASHRDPASKEARRKGHIFERLCDTLSYGGLKDIKIDKLEWMQGDISELGLKEPYVIIVPGCAPSRPEKRWLNDRYIEIANKLSAKDIQPVIIGTDAEKDVTTAIANGCESALDLTGKTSLYQVANLARNAKACIGNDTGPMHIIGPVGCPCVILYPGSSNAVRYRALGEKITTIQKEHMSDISAEDAFNALEKFL